MTGLKKQITARSVSLGFIIMVLGMMFLSTIVPQEMVAPPNELSGWRARHQGILWLVDIARLHRIYAQPWFAAAILCAAVSMVVSSWDQLVSAGRRLHATGTASAEEIAAAVSEQDLRHVVGSHGYRALKYNTADAIKFIRNPWGYYGNTLLHAGIVFVVIASLYVALSGRQGSLILVEGATCDKRQPWSYSERGLMAKPLPMPGSVRLEKVSVGFDAKDQPSVVSSEISIFRDSGDIDRLTATINTISYYQGMRIYHATQYGDAFTLEFTDPEGVRHFEKLTIQQPVGLTLAGYGDFELPWLPYVLSVKYYADADKKSMVSNNPELVLRLLNGEREISRVSLTRGSSGVMGNYRVRLLGVEKWSKLIFVDITGMPLIFAGFAIIMLGGLIHYLAPPREIIAVRQQDGLFQVYWKAPYFTVFFVEERDEIADEMQKVATG